METQKKILIVEDDRFVAELYEHQFSKNGFAVQVVADGKSALEAAGSERFDLILLDIMIPVVDGLEVLKKMKADPKTRDTIVVILSNLGQDEIIKKGLSEGARAYIVKSMYTPLQVVAEVRSILGIS